MNSGSIHQILEEDKDAPKKQRHTALRIFERLCEEHGFTGGYTIVKDAVRVLKQQHREVFLPLAHPPGQAQVDFGFAERENFARMDDRAVVTLDVIKRSGENIIETSDAVKAAIAEKTMRDGGFSPICQMLHGDTEEAISSYVSTNDIGLLVMGAYGHSRIRYLIIGSTTTEMIRTCKVPVLLFR